MELYLKEELQKEIQEIASLFSFSLLEEETRSFSRPRFGEVWICQIPILIVNDGEVTFETMSRPVLVVDDTREHFIKHDKKNYYVLKITTQKDSYQRIRIAHYKKLGLQKESFVRIELPLKVERCQLLYKIGEVGVVHAEKYVKLVRQFIQKYDRVSNLRKKGC